MVIVGIRNRRHFRHRTGLPSDQLLPAAFLFQESSFLEFRECLL